MKDIKTKKYFGYSIDLLDKIALFCNFSYEISIVGDGFHGKVIKTEDEITWNGLVKELINKVKFNITAF
jgi:hypothetical protein